ncbi:hypothetical protein L345_09136, partial [Ophiophagus hannah]
MKDQNKKVANLKHNQQIEKKKNAQLLEEVRRREDNMTDNAQHLQTLAESSIVWRLDSNLEERIAIVMPCQIFVCILWKNFLIVLKCKFEAYLCVSALELKLEELRNALDKTRQELDATKARLASTQQSLGEKEAHLANLRLERRKQLEEILEMKFGIDFQMFFKAFSCYLMPLADIQKLQPMLEQCLAMGLISLHSQCYSDGKCLQPTIMSSMLRCGSLNLVSVKASKKMADNFHSK